MTQVNSEGLTVAGEQVLPVWRALVDLSNEAFLDSVAEGRDYDMDPVLSADIEQLDAALEKQKEFQKAGVVAVVEPVTVRSVDTLRVGLVLAEDGYASRVSIRGLIKFGLEEVRESRRNRNIARSLLAILEP